MGGERAQREAHDAAHAEVLAPLLSQAEPDLVLRDANVCGAKEDAGVLPAGEDGREHKGREVADAPQRAVRGGLGRREEGYRGFRRLGCAGVRRRDVAACTRPSPARARAKKKLSRAGGSMPRLRWASLNVIPAQS